MSVPVELQELAERLGERGPVAYLVTVGDSGKPHVVSVRAELAGDQLTMGAGRRTLANVLERPDVTLLWPAAPGEGYSLIVDGIAARGPDAVISQPPAIGARSGEGSADAAAASATLVVRPTAAVMHRTPLGDPASPSCVTLIAGGSKS